MAIESINNVPIYDKLRGMIDTYEAYNNSDTLDVSNSRVAILNCRYTSAISASKPIIVANWPTRLILHLRYGNRIGNISFKLDESLGTCDFTDGTDKGTITRLEVMSKSGGSTVNFTDLSNIYYIDIVPSIHEYTIPVSRVYSGFVQSIYTPIYLSISVNIYIQ